MSNLGPPPSAGTSYNITAEEAIAVLADAARRAKGEAGVRTLLAVAGFKIAGFIASFASFVAPPNPTTETACSETIGQLVDGRGIYLGPWSFDPKYNPVEIYSAPDFLRDKSGKQLILSFDEAVKELTSRNDGRRYGNGAETALCQALRAGKYQDGDLVLAPREIQNGLNASDKYVRPGNNVVELLRTSPSFKKLLNVVNDSSSDARWSVSGSEVPDLPSSVWHARLTDGFDDWSFKAHVRSGVVPVRIFRRPSSQPVPAG